jgi:hypothetical protein
MTDIDLIDWTIQEAQHLKAERREPSDLDDGPSLEKLLTVLEREPVGPTNPEDPVAQIASAPRRAAADLNALHFLSADQLGHFSGSFRPCLRRRHPEASA